MNSSKKALLHMLAVSLLSASGAEFYEDFHDAPNLSEGWTFGATNNVKLSRKDGTSSVLDTKTSLPDERTALFVERKGTDAPVLVEILSPCSDDCIRRYSFFCKASSSGACSDRVSVFGRVSPESDWLVIGEPVFVTGSGQWPTNVVSSSLDIHQVKFVLESDVADFKNVGLDSLRVSEDEGEAADDDDPPEPTKPRNLKLEATAPDRIEATWEGVPGENGYRVELFRSEDGRETDTPDFSGLAAGTWPEGWTHSEDIGFGWYLEKLIKVLFNSCWFASPFYQKPITRFEYKFKSNKTSPEVGNTKLVVWVSKSVSDGDWIEFDRLQVTGSMSNVVSIIDAAEDVRRLRFSVDYQGSDTSYAREMLLGVNVLSIVCGERSEAFVAEAEPSEPTTIFSNLTATASYFVTVRPNPSNDLALVATSSVLDLSKEHFRRTGVLPVSEMRHGYEERFDSLSNFVSQTRTAKMKLDYWQFVLNGAEPETLGVSQTNSASSIAGCYVCRDKEKISSLDSSMIGTLASGERECAVGLAIGNDTGNALQNLKVTFDSEQRSSNANPATYAFEWRISDGETSIAAASGWTQVNIPQTAPFTSEKRSVMPEYRQPDIVATIPTKVPPGKFLLIRWRHPAMTNGPMMAIDNVRIAFDKAGGFILLIK